MTKTIVETGIHRKIIVTNMGKGKLVDLDVNDTSEFPDAGHRVYSLLEPEEAEKIGIALLGENATVVTDLPEAKFNDWTNRVYSGDCDRGIYTARDKLLETAKNLLAIYAFLIKRDAEKAEAEAKAAEEAEAKATARDKRRNELATEFRGYGGPTAYSASTDVFKAAIDRIIDLEEAAKV